MIDNHSNENNPAIERHDTAAWRGHIEKLQPASKVPIPSEEAVMEA